MRCCFNMCCCRERCNDRECECERNDDDRCHRPSERVCRERFVKETRISTRWHREGCHCRNEEKNECKEDERKDDCRCEGR